LELCLKYKLVSAYAHMDGRKEEVDDEPFQLYIHNIIYLDMKVEVVKCIKAQA